jgi:diadenosine tetraphosphatase ApaH/serine/threonine PP2A family protein phosphatase
MQALISDIHGNLEALQAVLEDIDSQGVTDIVCLGDMVGYGPNPRECVDLLRERCSLVLMGNHEQALFTLGKFNPVAKRALQWTRDQLESSFEDDVVSRLAFLAGLPRTHRDTGRLFVHASSCDPLGEYVHPEAVWEEKRMARLFAAVEHVCFQGHTHVPGVFLERPGEPSEFRGASEARTTHLRRHKAMVNVGSVGQPRDGDWRACYALFDGKAVHFQRVEYAVRTTMRKIRSLDVLDGWLAQRLGLGR